MNGGNNKYTKNSEKYVSGTLGEWSMKPKKSRVRGYGNPEPTLKVYVQQNNPLEAIVDMLVYVGLVSRDNKTFGEKVCGAKRFHVSLCI